MLIPFIKETIIYVTILLIGIILMFISIKKDDDDLKMPIIGLMFSIFGAYGSLIMLLTFLIGF